MTRIEFICLHLTPGGRMPTFAPVAIGDSGLAMDPEPDAHLALGDGEEGMVGTR